MRDINIGYDGHVILQSENVSWVSRGIDNIDMLVLTNKKLYCAYKRSNGLFKKATNELCEFSLVDIKIINGQAQVQQTKFEGQHCLSIQFRQGQELFSFSNSPKKAIPKWIAAINGALGTTEISQPEASKSFSSFLRKLSIDSLIDIVDPSHSQIPQQFKDYMEVSPDISSQGISNDIGPSTFGMSNFCPSCGAELPDGARFCSSCGTKITFNADKMDSPDFPPIGERKGTGSEKKDADYSIRQQEYVGKVFKCPNCGNVVNPSDTVCSACGFHLSGKKAVSSAMDFEQQLLKIEMTRQSKKIGFWDQAEPLDATDKQIIAFIKAYPIPNTIEDIVEFMHLTVGNINIEKSKKSFFNSEFWDGISREREISNAWIGKLQQIYRKAELYFPNEPEFVHVRELYESIMDQLK